MINIFNNNSLRSTHVNHQLLYACGIDDGVDFITDSVESGTFLSNDDADAPFQWLQKRADIIVKQGQGSLTLAAQSLNLKQDVILILPAHQGLLTYVEMPSRKQAHIRNALPFALAPQILGDVDGLHLAWKPSVDKGYLQVVGYDKQQLTKLLVACKAKGLRIKQVILDAQILPQNDDQWTLVADQQQWLLSYGNNQCCGIQSNMREMLLQQLWQSIQPGETVQVNIFGPQANQAKLILESTSFANLDLITPADAFNSLPSTHNDSSLSLLSYFYQRNQVISLLPKQNLGTKLQLIWQSIDQRLLKWAICCLLLMLLLLLVRNDSLQKQLVRSQTSLSLLQTSVSQELSKLPVPQNLLERIEVLQRMPTAPDSVLSLLHTWASIRAVLVADTGGLVLERMVYGNNQLRLVWLVDSQEQARQRAAIINNQKADIASEMVIKVSLSPYRDKRAETSYGQQIMTLQWRGNES